MTSNYWRLGVVALLFFILTAANFANYSNRMRQLNDVPLGSNPLGGDEYQIGARAARAQQQTFWVFEGGIVLICGGAWLLVPGASKPR